MVVETKKFQLTGITLLRSQSHKISTDRNYVQGRSQNQKFLLTGITLEDAVRTICELKFICKRKRRRHGVSNKEISYEKVEKMCTRGVNSRY